MTNRYNIRNGARDFYLSKIQNYLLFIVTRNIDLLVMIVKSLNCGALKECNIK